MIVDQYGEHRLIPSKLLYCGYYLGTGTVNFRVLGIIGDLQLIPVGLVGVSLIRRTGASYWPVLASWWMLAVFDLNTYENASMTMNAVGNYGVLCYFFLALYGWTKNSRGWWIFAGISQALCMFSNANGLVGGVMLVAFFSLYSPITIKKRAILILTATLIPLYFIHYHIISLPNKLPFSVGRALLYLINMSGAPISFQIAGLCGIGILAAAALLFPWRQVVYRQWSEYMPLCVGMAWVGATMILTAMFRADYKDAQFQTSRYLIYPQILIACTLILLSGKFKRKWPRIAGLSGITIGMLMVWQQNKQFGIAGFKRSEIRATALKYWYPNYKQADTITKRACELGIYCIDENR